MYCIEARTVLVTLLGLFGDPAVIRRPGNCSRRYAPGHDPKFLTYLNVSCFETRCHKRNTVARLN